MSDYIPPLDYCGNVDGGSVPILHSGCLLDRDAKVFLVHLADAYPEAEINFDKILRFEASVIDVYAIVSMIGRHGFSCRLIPDRVWP
ncbi:hypothetical protein [Reichenbachiella agariperforans]|uniref:hypothetical protein n=1 Tax=Reichenbachiella agariperforans TaxID=156994 RepID=UPI001C09EF67|nr:hypothetical protein [Reichenbachiella agariperforans]MBU2914624.1 hypothetical protein [Reichenbachiella agariperforans]